LEEGIAGQSKEKKNRRLEGEEKRVAEWGFITLRSKRKGKDAVPQPEGKKEACLNI